MRRLAALDAESTTDHNRNLLETGRIRRRPERLIALAVLLFLSEAIVILS